MNKTEQKLMQREYRDFTDFYIDTPQAETEAEQEVKELVRGYATTYDQPYVLYEDNEVVIMEVVVRGAFVEADISDVIMQYDHRGHVYARNKNGTLNIDVLDEKGLGIAADLDGTDIGKQLKQEIRGGYTTKMSIGFTVAEDDRVTVEENGKIVELRTIRKVKKLYDVSAVSIPANDNTSISVRNYVDGVLALREAERLKTEKRKKQLKRIKLALKILEV